MPPESTVAVQVTVWPIDAGEGEAEQLTVIGFPEITKLKVVGPLVLAGEPVTVMRWVPTEALGETLKVIMDSQLGEHPWAEMPSTDTPEGRPDTDRVTGWVAPETSVLVIVFWVKASLDVLVTFEVPEFERL